MDTIKKAKISEVWQSKIRILRVGYRHLMCSKLATHARLCFMLDSYVFKKKLYLKCHWKSPKNKRFSQSVAELSLRKSLYNLYSLTDSKCKCHALGGRYPWMYPIISLRETSFPATSSETLHHSELSFKFWMRICKNKPLWQSVIGSDGLLLLIKSHCQKLKRCHLECNLIVTGRQKHSRRYITILSESKTMKKAANLLWLWIFIKSKLFLDPSLLL